MKVETRLSLCPGRKGKGRQVRETMNQSQAGQGCEPQNGMLDSFWGWKGKYSLWGWGSSVSSR